jgi:hypothetical protein
MNLTSLVGVLWEWLLYIKFLFYAVCCGCGDERVGSLRFTHRCRYGYNRHCNNMALGRSLGQIVLSSRNLTR